MVHVPPGLGSGCTVPDADLPGYDAQTLECSRTLIGDVSCETNAICADGYSGTVTYACHAERSALVLSGCEGTHVVKV